MGMKPSNEEKKNKRTTNCDKSIIKYDVGTTKCDNGTIKCEKNKKKSPNETKE